MTLQELLTTAFADISPDDLKPVWAEGILEMSELSLDQTVPDGSIVSVEAPGILVVDFKSESTQTEGDRSSQAEPEAGQLRLRMEIDEVTFGDVTRVDYLCALRFSEFVEKYRLEVSVEPDGIYPHHEAADPFFPIVQILTGADVLVEIMFPRLKTVTAPGHAVPGEGIRVDVPWHIRGLIALLTPPVTLVQATVVDGDLTVSRRPLTTEELSFGSPPFVPERPDVV
ncbi:hypothetical protein [Brevibacterium metallidurans]|uniref:DUF2993 domain-containing protein n=1 Tax=Brevibacterium metallidurans TaxID=1482676 RepID=A0ABN0SNK8_9MICO